MPLEILVMRSVIGSIYGFYQSKNDCMQFCPYPADPHTLYFDHTSYLGTTKLLGRSFQILVLVKI